MIKSLHFKAHLIEIGDNVWFYQKIKMFSQNSTLFSNRSQANLSTRVCKQQMEKTEQSEIKIVHILIVYKC
jgi:hypothetical protein